MTAALSPAAHLVTHHNLRPVASSSFGLKRGTLSADGYANVVPLVQINMEEIMLTCYWTKRVLCGAMFLACPAAFAQGPKCQVSVPALVVLSNASLMRNMKADDFVSLDKQRPVVVQSVRPVVAPRRILFVVETGRHLTADVRAA